MAPTRADHTTDTRRDAAGDNHAGPSGVETSPSDFVVSVIENRMKEVGFCAYDTVKNKLHLHQVRHNKWVYCYACSRRPMCKR